MNKNEELQKCLNNDRYVQRKELETMWNMGKSDVNGFLSYRKIRPVKMFNTGQGRRAFYDKKQCINARSIYDAQLQELQNCLNDTKLIQAQELALKWGVTTFAASSFLHIRNIKPIKKINAGRGSNSAFYDRAECERARPFINQPEKKVEKVENIGELATATKYQILCETGADNFVWDKVTMKHKIMPVKNYCDERGNFVSLFKKDETVSAILAYKNEQKQLLEKCLADKNLVTTKDLETIWNCKKSNVYSKIYKLKIKPHVKVKLENGNMWHFYKRSDCFEFCKQTDDLIANNERLLPIENNNYNLDIHVTMKDLMKFTGRSRYMIMQRFINKGIAPVGTPLIGKTVSYVYDLQKALDAVSDVLKPRYRKLLVKKQKEINPMEQKQMELPEPKEQMPDIIPADTIDLFTMSEFESELRNRGVELTDEVKAKINASDMPEMQDIATMIRGNAKTIAIRLSVLNEIAGQLREIKCDGKNELLDEIGKPRVLWLNMQERIVFEFLRHKTNYTPKSDIVEHFKAMRQPIGDSAANRMVWSAISVLRDMGCLDAQDGCFMVNSNYTSTEAESREVWGRMDASKRKTDLVSIDIGLENGRPINDKIKESGWYTVGIISEISGKSESWLRSHLPVEDCLIAYGNDKLIKAWRPKRVIKWLNDRNIFVRGWGDMIKRPKNGMRKYNPDFDKIAFDMASQNKSDTEISNQLNVTLETFNKYKKEIPSFANAINSGMSAYISSITSLQSNEKNQENKGVCINQDLKDKLRFMAMADNVDLAAKLESIIMAAWVMGNYDNK